MVGREFSFPASILSTVVLCSALKNKLLSIILRIIFSASLLNYEEIESHYGHQKGTGLKHPLWLCVENGRASTRELVVHLLGNVQCRVRVVSSV